MHLWVKWFWKNVLAHRISVKKKGNKNSGLQARNLVAGDASWLLRYGEYEKTTRIEIFSGKC